MLKRFCGAVITLCMLTGLMPVTVSANSMDFGSRAQMNWNDCTKKQWGTIGLEKGKILKSGEGSSIENIDDSYSVFNQFSFNRGIDTYTGFSDGTTFAYDTTQSIYGAKLANGKYFYAVYNKSNNKNDYKVDLAARFGSDIKELIQKGDIEIAIAAETNNYKGSTNKMTGVANLRFYNWNSPIQQEITTAENWYDGVRTVTAGWIKPNSDISRMMLNLRSKRKGITKKFNKSSVQKVRVFLRDNVGPAVKSCGIYGGDFAGGKNIAGDSVSSVSVDGTVRFYVEFDERIDVTEPSKVKLRLRAKHSNETNTAKFDAEYDTMVGRKMIFKYKVPDNTFSSKELDALIEPVQLIDGKKYIFDIAGNALKDDSIRNYSSKLSDVVCTVDDTKTRFDNQSFGDTKKFYPAVTNMSKISCNLYGDIPQEIKSSGENKAQPVMFSASGSTGPIFRILLDDEIKKEYLNSSTRLKLQVYDTDKNKVTENGSNKYVYANLVGARIAGVSSGDRGNGIKSDAYTELYFRYCPGEISGHPLYKINFAGDYKSDGKTTYYECEDDLLTNNGKKLRNISNMEVNGGNLRVPEQYKSYMPINIMESGITIDTQAPGLTENTISQNWTKAFESNTKLVFEDDGGFDYGAKVSFVYYDDNGQKQILPVRIKGAKSNSTVLDIEVNREQGSKNKSYIDISDIGLVKEHKADHDIYLEYRVSDKAGNIATNENQKNIRIYLDNTAPEVKSVEQIQSGRDMRVKYNVTDTGIGKIDPKIEYTLINYTKDTSSDEATTDNNQEINVAAVSGSYDTWEVLARFGDTLGNWNEQKTSSGKFSTAARQFILELNDSADSIVSDKHKITVDPKNIPADNSSFEVKYGWVRGGTASKNDAKSSQSFGGLAELTAFDFASENIQKQYNAGNLFDGEFTLYMEVTMTQDAFTQSERRSFYFDVKAPEGTVTIEKKRDGVNPSYNVVTNLTDDGGTYKNGAYAIMKNIDFSEGNAPVMKLYIGDTEAASYDITTCESMQSIDFNAEFGNDERFVEATSARVKVIFKDKFGHSAEITSEDMAVDFKAPELTSITVSPVNLARYEDAYIINSFADITSITAEFTDNVNDKLDVTCYEGGWYKTVRTDARSYTSAALLNNDFTYDAEKGYVRYMYTFNITDMAGNYTSASVPFVMDYYAPEIYYTNTESINGMTNKDSAEVEMRYRIDDYENAEDIDIEVSGSGAKLADVSQKGIIKLSVTENGTVTVTTRDKAGKTGTKSIDVNCFDREIPVISFVESKQTPESGAAKYGEITLSASDNDSLTVLGIAMVQGEAGENDFFEDSADYRITGYTGSEETEDKEPIYAENGYFGDASGAAFARIVPQNTAADGTAAAKYKLVYGSIPDGSYNIYARISDNAGNVRTEKLTTVLMTNAGAEAEVSYTPGSDTPTGGSVTVSVHTDIPTQLLGSKDADDNVSLMLENAARMRKEGYTYVYGGETKHLTFAEAQAEYRRIIEKYNAQDELTDEEDMLVKYKVEYGTEEALKYTEFLFDNRYAQPVNDLLDYLVNQCLYDTTSYDLNGFTDYGKSYLDVDTQYGAKVYFAETGDMEIYDDMRDFFEKYDDPENPYKPLIDVPAVENGRVLFGVNLNEYPSEFDEFNPPLDIDRTKLTESEWQTPEEELSISNPFDGKAEVSAAELYGFFGMNFDLSLAELQPSGLYKNPFGTDENVLVKDISADIKQCMDEYLKDNTVLYESPFTLHGGERTYAAIKRTLNSSIPKYQAMREAAVENAADKYVRSYMTAGGDTFSTEHIIVFDNNTDREFGLMDEIGRRTSLPINISWIDHTRPYVPQKNIVFSINGVPFTEGYTKKLSGKVEVTMPSGGIFDEYYITNLPDGAAGTPEKQTADGKSLYKSFTAEVYDNRTVEFDVLNPTVSEMDLTHQVYTIDRFDRTAPTYELVYSIKKPTDGSAVNTDVTVSLDNVKDNRSSVTSLKINEESHTFAQNGSFTFTIEDEAGNKAEIPVMIDYIDKTPVNLTAEFIGAEAGSFDITSNMSDYKNSTFRYKYNGGYLKNDVTAVISYNGQQVGVCDISDDEEYAFEYTSKAGNKGRITFSGVKFDKQAPEAEITYTPIAATMTGKDSVEASVSLSDNINSAAEITLKSVNGRDNTGTEFTAADVTTGADGSRILKFKNNGFANLVFADRAGNTTEVQLSVSSLDRSVPRAFVSYSSTTPTNSDVIATVNLNKLADYEVYGEGNQKLKEYSGAYASYITYTFEENGNRLFKFRDRSGNETEELLVSVNNIDKVKPELEARIEKNKIVDESGKLVDFMGAATIVLEVKSAGDRLNGDDNDTIFIQNSAQSPYHSVMGNGRYTYKYMDTAGNFDTLYVDVDCIDTEPPTADVEGNPTAWINIAPKITLKAVQKSSGAKSYIVMNGQKKDSIEFTPDKNGKYSFMVTDEIGNSASKTVDVKYVDLNAPEITVNNNDVYKGSRNVFISAGAFDKAAFEDVKAEDDESGINGDISIDYADFDQNVPGLYPVKFSVSDNAGNTAVLTRYIQVIGPDDVFASLNGRLLIPGSQTRFAKDEELELEFINADKVGSKVAYAFAKGYYNGAQMKGKSFKRLENSNAKVKLQPDGTGLYTLFVQTENRNVMVMYVFIAG